MNAEYLLIYRLLAQRGLGINSTMEGFAAPRKFSNLHPETPLNGNPPTQRNYHMAVKECRTIVELFPERKKNYPSSNLQRHVDTIYEKKYEVFILSFYFFYSRVHRPYLYESYGVKSRSSSPIQGHLVFSAHYPENGVIKNGNISILQLKLVCHSMLV